MKPQYLNISSANFKQDVHMLRTLSHHSIISFDIEDISTESSNKWRLPIHFTTKALQQLHIFHWRSTSHYWDHHYFFTTSSTEDLQPPRASKMRDYLFFWLNQSTTT